MAASWLGSSGRSRRVALRGFPQELSVFVWMWAEEVVARLA